MSNPLDPANLFSVRGLVAIITGGGTGIGLMMARALAEGGAARVYIVGRRVDILQQAAASINKPSVIVPLYCDVTSKISLEAIASLIATDVGFLNLVVCNAGIGGPQVPFPEAGSSGGGGDGATATAATTLDEWRDRQLAFDYEEFTSAFRVNTVSVWYTAMTFLKLLDLGNKRGNVDQSSQVVVVGSIAAFNRRAPGGWAYGQSKAAATHMVKQLSTVLPTWNVRANCIAPGLFPSAMSAPIVENAGGNMNEPGQIPLETSVVPLGRMGDHVDMAGQILYLTSRAGAYCNGNVIVIDGGRLTTFPATGY